jgi:hypothetical protein
VAFAEHAPQSGDRWGEADQDLHTLVEIAPPDQALEPRSAALALGEHHHAVPAAADPRAEQGVLVKKLHALPDQLHQRRVVGASARDMHTPHARRVASFKAMRALGIAGAEELDELLPLQPAAVALRRRVLRRRSDFSYAFRQCDQSFNDSRRSNGQSRSRLIPPSDPASMGLRGRQVSRPAGGSESRSLLP